MTNDNNNRNLTAALQNLSKAFCEVLKNCSDEEMFNSKYPFNICFRELVDDVNEWVDQEIEDRKGK